MSDFSNTSIGKSYLFMIMLLFKTQKFLSITLVIVATIQGLIAPTYIWLTGVLVNSIEAFLLNEGIETLIWPIVGFLALITFQHIVHLLAETIRSFLQTRLTTELQYRFMNKAKEISLSYFENEELYNKMHRANKIFGNKIINTFEYIINIFTLIVSLFGYITILFSVHYIILIILLSLIFPSLYLKIRRTRMNYNVTYHDLTPVERERSYYEKLLTDVSVLKERKNFNLFELFFDRWKRSQTKIRGLLLKNTFGEIKTSVFIDFLNLFTYSLILVILCLFVVLRLINIASFVVLTQTVVRMQETVEEVVEIIRLMYDQGLNFKDLMEFLNTNEEKDFFKKVSNPSSDPLPNLDSKITFKNIYFKYPNSNSWVLENVSFEIKKGETIVIIGENGSGKTTLMKILAALYEPAKGEIYYDNISYSQLNPKEILKKISVIFQNHINIKFTLKEAIGLGDISNFNDFSKIKSAAKKIGVDEIAQTLPLKYDTPPR